MKTSIFKTCLIYLLQDSTVKRELIATRQRFALIRYLYVRQSLQNGRAF